MSKNDRENSKKVRESQHMKGQEDNTTKETNLEKELNLLRLLPSSQEMKILILLRRLFQ